MIKQKDNRGGARKGAGRKASDGAVGLVPYPTKVTPAQKQHIIDHGGLSYLRALIEADMARQK